MQLKNQTNQDNLLDSTSPIHRYPPLYNHFQKAVYSAHFIHFLTFNFSFHRTLASALFHSTEIALAKTANDLPSHLIQSILQPPLAAYFSSPSLSAPSWKLSLGFCDTRFSWFPFFFLLSTLYTEPGVWGVIPTLPDQSTRMLKFSSTYSGFLLFIAFLLLGDLINGRLVFNDSPRCSVSPDLS